MDMEQLLAENLALRASYDALLIQYARLEERLDELLAIVKQKQKKDSKSSAPAVASLILEEAEKLAFEDRPKPPEKPIKIKDKKKSKPTGRKKIPEHLKAEKHTLRPETCSCGCQQLDVVDRVIETKLHVVAEHLRRREVERLTVRCRACGERTTARSLPAPYERSKTTCEFLAWLVYSKFVLLMPLDRIRRHLEMQGVSMAMSTLVTQIERAADLLGPVDGAHWRALLKAEWMAMDATGLKVLIPGLPKAHNGYIEAFRNNELVVFQYEPNKGSEALINKLTHFSGILVADAESRHNPVFADGSILEAGCNAHGRRKFEEAEAVQPVLALEGGRWIGAIYGEEERARELGLTGDSLKQHRQTFITPLKESLLEWMNVVKPTLLPSDLLVKAIQYYENHWDALFRFIDHPDIPIDNSATEREFQNVAKLRMNMLFAGSTEGAHRATVLLGIAATCRHLGVDPQAYMCWAFQRLGTHRDLYQLGAEEVTPAAYKASLAT